MSRRTARRARRDRRPPANTLGCTPASRARMARREALEVERKQREAQAEARRFVPKPPSKGALTLAAALALAQALDPPETTRGRSEE